MKNVFTQVKNNTDIIAVAERYGIEINKHNKALCIFHDDKTASMSFKNNYFTCFSCRAKGSAIDIVMKLFNLTAIDACKKMNVDFDLKLDLKNGNYKPDTELVKQREYNRALKKSLENWVDEMHSKYSAINKNYRIEMNKYKPSSENDEISEVYAFLVNKIARNNYILDILERGTAKEKTGLYRELNKLKKAV